MACPMVTVAVFLSVVCVVEEHCHTAGPAADRFFMEILLVFHLCNVRVGLPNETILAQLWSQIADLCRKGLSSTGAWLTGLASLDTFWS